MLHPVWWSHTSTWNNGQRVEPGHVNLAKKKNQSGKVSKQRSGEGAAQRLLCLNQKYILIFKRVHLFIPIFCQTTGMAQKRKWYKIQIQRFVLKWWVYVNKLFYLSLISSHHTVGYILVSKLPRLRTCVYKWMQLNIWKFIQSQWPMLACVQKTYQGWGCSYDARGAA
mgnify:CR=1 FL=1